MRRREFLVRTATAAGVAWLSSQSILKALADQTLGQKFSASDPVTLGSTGIKTSRLGCPPCEARQGTFQHQATYIHSEPEVSPMFTFLLWCILFILCWPLALLALVAYPFIWLLLLPFRIVGVAVHGVLEVIYLAITLPFRLLAAPFRI